MEPPPLCLVFRLLPVRDVQAQSEELLVQEVQEGTDDVCLIQEMERVPLVLLVKPA